MSEQIYLDRDQCENFEVPYFEAATVRLRADSILSSKWQGYDKFHVNTLTPLGSASILLERKREDSPGWYTIKEEL